MNDLAFAHGYEAPQHFEGSLYKSPRMEMVSVLDEKSPDSILKSFRNEENQ